MLFISRTELCYFIINFIIYFNNHIDFITVAFSYFPSAVNQILLYGTIIILFVKLL